MINTITHSINSATTHTKHEIKNALTQAMQSEHLATSELLFWLARYDEKAMYLEEGYASLYSFLTTGHGYSEGAAMRRIKACRMARRFPGVLDFVANGDVSLTVAALVGDAAFTHEQLTKVFSDLRKKSKREAEDNLARLNERPATPKKPKESIKPIGVIKNVPVETPRDLFFIASETNDQKVSLPEQTFTEPSSPNSLFNEPTTPSPSTISQLIYKLSLEMSEDDLAALKRAGEISGADGLVETIAKITEFYLEKKDPLRAKEKNKNTKASKAANAASTTANLPITPQPSTAPITAPGDGKKSSNQPTPNHQMRSRYIPKKIRQNLLQKYAGQCGYVCKETGIRCSERQHLEVEHIRPFAKNGDHSEENLMLLCKAHNLYQAKLQFGEAFISSKMSSTQ